MVKRIYTKDVQVVVVFKPLQYHANDWLDEVRTADLRFRIWGLTI